jgi:hypothetical protein
LFKTLSVVERETRAPPAKKVSEEGVPKDIDLPTDKEAVLRAASPEERIRILALREFHRVRKAKYRDNAKRKRRQKVFFTDLNTCVGPD